MIKINKIEFLIKNNYTVCNIYYSIHSLKKSKVIKACKGKRFPITISAEEILKKEVANYEYWENKKLK